MNNTIVIAPWAQTLRTGKRNAKNYPHWNELVVLLKYCGFYTIQVGVEGEQEIGADEKRTGLSFKELEELIKSSFLVISVDSFMQHFCWMHGVVAIVIWGKSDPEIFGHKENINLLKDRQNLREYQFRWWDDVEYSEDVFVSTEVVMVTILKYLSNLHFSEH